MITRQISPLPPLAVPKGDGNAFRRVEYFFMLGRFDVAQRFQKAQCFDRVQRNRGRFHCYLAAPKDEGMIGDGLDAFLRLKSAHLSAGLIFKCVLLIFLSNDQYI